ncbi:MAG TPA: hypothetical protein DF383_12320 [Deltaproteobacteria bacterium]|nr:hypothetical protein [Deltaproteobacteria bacterium]
MRFEFADRGNLKVRAETVACTRPVTPLRLLFASDLHLFRSRHSPLIDQILSAASDSRPDVILLGGDLVDRAAALPALASLVRQLRQKAPVGAIAGNHDVWIGVSKVRRAVEQGGGLWLGDQSFFLPSVESPSLRIDGRLNMDLQASIPRILCAHHPAIFPQAHRAGYRIILAGHLHGGQWVWAELGGRLFPGAWLNRWNGLRFEKPGATLLVSRGVSDTIPLRWNCPREVLLCTIGTDDSPKSDTVTEIEQIAQYRDEGTQK